MNISVIIPVLNEASNIENFLNDLLESSGEDVEIIVVDGGSSDDTIQIAQKSGVKVFSSQKGRGTQMDLGAENAKSEVLLFLHSDVQLPANWHENIINAYSENTCISLGAFSFKISAKALKYRVIEYFVGLRNRLLKIPFGDQCLFIKSEIYDKLNGFKGLPLMEDVDIVRRAKRLGPVVILKDSALVSPRRWERKGVIKTTLTNIFIFGLYYLGFSNERLYKIYYK